MRRLLIVSVMLSAVWAMGGPALADGVLTGRVLSKKKPLEGYAIGVFATGTERGVPLPPERIGIGLSDSRGRFAVRFETPTIPHAVIYVLAARSSVVLAGALGPEATLPGAITINERTTVATGFAFAQFIQGTEISGNRYGVSNAVHMAANLANVVTGEIGEVLGTPPNGPDTSTRRTFNSLSNMVALCTRRPNRCNEFLHAAMPTGGTRPTNTLAALAQIAKNPSAKPKRLFNLSKEFAIYRPGLARRPSGWTLFVRFTGTDSSRQTRNDLLNGPGLFAIDEVGNLWVNDNYEPRPPLQLACTGRRLLKFFPWGEPYPDTPYFGGGLEGSGWGLTLDPHGNVWVANFGFEGRGCEDLPRRRASHDSISKFTPNGQPISPPDGFKAQDTLDWPMGTVSDQHGNIWIANCVSGTVVRLQGGNPERAQEFDTGVLTKAFGVAIGLGDTVWVTGNLSSNLVILGPDGTLRRQVNRNLNRPMGIAADSKGNMWVSNSGITDVPCPPGNLKLGDGNSSVALFGPNGAPIGRFTGGGITAPFGIAVDGSDTVWVADFGGAKVSERRIGRFTQPRVSRFCGASPEKCPVGHQAVGQPISPEEGYTSDALVRTTGVAIDPSGNVWLANNWKLVPPRINPGGNAIVVLIGAATPVKPPLIGLPESFDDRGGTQTSLIDRIRVLRPSDSIPLEPVQPSSTTLLFGGTVQPDEVTPHVLTPEDVESDTVEASEFQPLEIAPKTIVPEVVE